MLYFILKKLYLKKYFYNVNSINKFYKKKILNIHNYIWIKNKKKIKKSIKLNKTQKSLSFII